MVILILKMVLLQIVLLQMVRLQMVLFQVVILQVVLQLGANSSGKALVRTLQGVRYVGHGSHMFSQSWTTVPSAFFSN